MPRNIAAYARIPEFISEIPEFRELRGQFPKFMIR